MQSELKNCQVCKKDFLIESDDFLYYEKIQVPPPIFCPRCRMQRKYIWRNERTLYRRTCDKTGKSIVSMYAPENRFPVYDIQEWWSDSWDPKDYAQDFDFTRPFFEQFKELQNKVPRLALLSKNNINSDFSNHSSNSKDAYMCTTAFDCENVMHSADIIPMKNGADCYNIQGKANEHLYECIDLHNCYNCQYCFRVESSFDCYYSFDLRNCSNCFLSYNLRGQTYCFMNQKYPKEEYFEKIRAYNLSSYAVRQALYRQWKELIFQKALHRGMYIEASVNCSGNNILNSKNAHYCFDIESSEDSRYLDFTTGGMKDSYDCYHAGINAELLYECHGITRSANLKFTHLSYDDTNLTYCDSCHNSNELFGCVGVKKGSYMILNKQYSKEEYFELKEKIIAYMLKTGEYGNFFPPDCSPFAYNETQAHVYMPLTHDEVLKLGFTWKENMPGTYGRETISFDQLPDSINDINDSILQEIFKCERTGKNYNVVRQEYEFLKTHNLPIPRLHPDERYKDRIRMRPDRALYNGVCAISGEKISTGYPEQFRPKMIVTDEIYKREVL